jgi:putative endopeptidase
MRIYSIRLTIALLLLAAFSVAQAPLAKEGPAGTNSPDTTAPRPDPKFDINYIDKSLDPCQDFYQYACAKWMKSNPIPGDYTDWVSFSEVYEHNLAVLHAILEKAAANDPARNAVTQKIGDFYASCMDEKTANEQRGKPLQPELDRIAAVKDKTQMIEVMARLEIIGPNPLVGFGATPDFHNSEMMQAWLDQSGITLPDRDYYLKDDADMVVIRKTYVEHMQKMFALLGQTPEQASRNAATVMRIETALAKAYMDRTLRRDPKNLDHKMTVTEVQAIAPNVHLDRFFAAFAPPAFKDLNVGNPDYFKQINTLVDATPLDDWKVYMTWQILNNSATWLSDDFVQEDFQFQKALTGQQELPVRWKRCVNATDGALGEALGQPYVDATFGPDGKQRMLKMVDALEKSLNKDISDLPWMTAETKKQALVKLAAIRNKIGYPDRWRDYSKLTIVRGDLVGNLFRASEFETNRQVQKIGQPVDKLEWGMTPPTVNAYYSGAHNEIVFPAGILQPPFFDKTMDDAVNFGGIGLVIGHELTHGFDDEGRKFDPKGNLRDWWTEKDAAEFEKRAGCIDREYSSFVSIDDLHLNGKLTLGENTADNGGARIALMALHNMMAETRQDPKKAIDGFTPDQRYFLGFARVWCENMTPETARVGVRTDPHSPGRWRVNGVVRNMPEFQKAFGCKAGAPMAPANACHVW